VRGLDDCLSAIEIHRTAWLVVISNLLVFGIRYFMNMPLEGWTRQALERFKGQVPMTIIEWDHIIVKITAKGMADKANKISPVMSQDAKERSFPFLKNSRTWPTVIRFLTWLRIWESHNPR
jgi:hypothetical protein